MKLPLATFRLLAVLICVIALLMFGATILRGGDKEPPPTAPKLPTTMMRAATYTLPCESTGTPHRTLAMFRKYRPILEGHLNWNGLGEWHFMEENGDWTNRDRVIVSYGYFMEENGYSANTYGIIVDVERRVDESTLTPKYQMWIPHCLEGVPVQIIEHLSYFRFPEELTLEEIRAQIKEEERRRLGFGLGGRLIDWWAEEKWRRWGFGLLDRWIDWWAK